MHAPATRPTIPASRPHLLDATMLWSSEGSGAVRRLLSCKRTALSALHWQHTLMAPGVDGPGRIDCGGIPLPAASGYRFVVDRRRAAQLIERAAPDLIESGDPYTLGWAALDAAQRLRVPAIAFCHMHLPALAARLVAGDGGPSTWVGRWAERQAGDYLARLYAGYDLVLAPSRGLVRELAQLGVQRVRYQPLGVDCSIFSPAADDPRWRWRLTQRLQLPADLRLVVYAGRFTAEKRLDLVADAVRRLGPRYRLLAVGSGPRPPTGAQVIVLPAEESGRRVARLLASSDCFVHAGDHESFGLSALEAMACGTPVVASAQGGLGELVAGAGTTVESRQPEAWAEAIAAAIDDGDSQLAYAALQRAQSLHWPLVMAELIERYESLLDAAPPEAPSGWSDEVSPDTPLRAPVWHGVREHPARHTPDRRTLA
jgi:alpha-1,6-mannosyltransferase